MTVGSQVREKSSGRIGTIVAETIVPNLVKVEFWNPVPRWDFDVETLTKNKADLETVNL